MAHRKKKKKVILMEMSRLRRVGMQPFQKPKRMRSKWPLAACLGAGLMLLPGNACAIAGAVSRPEANQAKVSAKRHPGRATDQELIRLLLDEDIKKAAEAGRILAGRASAVDPLLELADSDTQRSRIRALAVISRMDWKRIHKKTKAKVAKRVLPRLIAITLSGRPPGSYLAEQILLSIGNESIPQLTGLLSKEKHFLRFVGLAVLCKVDWKKIRPSIAMEAHDSLERMMEKEKRQELRAMARQVWRSIRKAYMWAHACPLPSFGCPELDRGPKTRNATLGVA